MAPLKGVKVPYLDYLLIHAASVQIILAHLNQAMVTELGLVKHPKVKPLLVPVLNLFAICNQHK